MGGLLDRWSLQYRITASVGIGLGAILVLFGLIAFWSIRQTTDAALQDRRELAVLLAHQLDSVFGNVPAANLDAQALTDMLNVSDPHGDRRLSVQVIDRQGTIIASSSPQRFPSATEHARILADLIAARRAGVRLHEPPSPGAAHIVAWAPLHMPAGGEPASIGAAGSTKEPPFSWGLTVEQTEDIALALPRRLRDQMLAAGALALLVATGFAWLDTRHVVQPLRAVTAAAQQIAAGDLGVPLADGASRRRDEVGRLTVALDTMRGRLMRSLAEIRVWNQQLERRVQQRTQELAAATAQRRQLLSKVIWAQEEERKRLARELHDDTVQTLSGLAMMLQAIEDGLPANLARERERLAWARERATRAAGEIRQLILDLRPSVLDDLGLIAAVRWYAGAHLQPRGIALTIDAPPANAALPATVQTAAFRVLQEAIANVARHARANHVHITLAVTEQVLTASVQDDGCGFDVDAARAGTTGEMGMADPSATGLGLLGMEERVTLLGGTLNVRSRPGKGTRVAFRLPLESLAEDSIHTQEPAEVEPAARTPVETGTVATRPPPPSAGSHSAGDYQ